MTSTLQLRLFSAPQISRDGVPIPNFVTRKAMALLIYLAMNPRRFTRDALAGFFWPEVAEQHARNSLRRILPNLRDLVGDHLLIDRYTMAFDRTQPYWIDAEVFLSALPALQTNVQHELVRAAGQTTLEQTLALYQGDFLDGFYVRDATPFDEWSLLQREQLRTVTIDGLIKLADYYMARGDYPSGLATTKRLLSIEPWCETAHQQQMRLLAQNNQHLAALEQYELCRTILATEFATQPSAAMTALYEQLKASQPDHAPRAVHNNDHRFSVSPAQIPAAQPDLPSFSIVDWGEIPRLASFYGRQSELNQLKQWLLYEHCTLVSLMGVGGVGKTALATQLVRNLGQAVNSTPTEHGFDRISWRSLLNAPPLATVLHLWLQDLSNQQLTILPTNLDEQLTLLFSFLRQQRCLLVLDNLESILHAGESAGEYLPGYETYGLLFQRMGELEHKSCLLLTSRELPIGVARLERTYSVVRSLHLSGLPAASGIQLLRAAGLEAESAPIQALVQRYSGNPLALRLVAEIVMDHYQGNADIFLNQEMLIFEDIRTVLDQQFRRLSALEAEIMIWLTIEREPISIQHIERNLSRAPSQRALLEAIRSLQRRSLLEQGSQLVQASSANEVTFGLQNVVLEYSTERLREKIYAELTSGDLDYCLRYALVKAQAADYVRAAQIRLLLQPIAQRLLESDGRQIVADKLKTLVDRLRTDFPTNSGYAAANLLHLAFHLEIKLDDWDFSRLSIWQADLRKCRLPRTNFSQAHFSNTAFMEKFDAILAVAFSADGDLLAAGGASGNVHLWRARDSELLSICRGRGRWVWAVTFSPVGDLLASSGSDCVVHLWELTEFSRDGSNTGETGPIQHPLVGHTNTIFGLAFSPDGQRLASASADQTIGLWDITSKQLIQMLLGHTATVYAVAFSPDGQLLASASRDQTVRIWQAATGACLQVLEAHQTPVVALCFSSDGQWLVTASVDNKVKVWQIESNPSGNAPLAQLHHSLANDTVEILALALSPDGASIATNGPNATIRLWQCATGKLIKTIHGHTENVQALAFYPDGRTLVSGAWDQSARLWDVATGYPLRTLQGYTNAIGALALSPDGQFLVSGNADATLCLWQAPTRRLVQVQEGHRGSVQAVAFHPSGRRLASGSSDCTVQLWAVSDDQLIPRQTLRGHSGGILSVCFSPTGQLIATGSADQTIRLWETHTGDCLQVYHGHTRMIQTLVFSSDGKYILSGSDDGCIYRWETAIDAEVEPNRVAGARAPQPFATLPGGISSLAFSLDGSLLAGAGPDHTIFLWRADGGEKLISFAAPVNSTIFALAFRPHPDSGKFQLASSSGTGAICFWDIDLATKGHQLNYLISEHKGSVRSIQFTPDGQTLISGGADETVRFWAVETGRCLGTVPLEQPYVGMNITGATGLTAAQHVALRTLGAFDANEH